MPGFRLFVYQLDGDILKVYEDSLSGAPVTIGFNRKKDGLDVLVPLDLRVAESTIATDGSINRRRSDEMLDQFAVRAPPLFPGVIRVLLFIAEGAETRTERDLEKQEAFEELAKGESWNLRSY